MQPQMILNTKMRYSAFKELVQLYRIVRAYWNISITSLLLCVCLCQLWKGNDSVMQYFSGLCIAMRSAIITTLHILYITQLSVTSTFSVYMYVCFELLII